MPQPPSVLDVIESKLLPWVLQDGMERFIVAHARKKHMKAQPGIGISSQKMKGPRKSVRAYSFGGLSAIWPNDHLFENHTPLLAFVLAGQADLHCGDYVLKVPEKHAVFVPGDVPRWSGVRSLEHLGDNPQRFSDSILFLQNSGGLRIWFYSQRGNDYRVDPSEIFMLHSAPLLRLLKEMQQEVMTPRFNKEEICRRLLEIFLLSVQRDLRESKFVAPGKMASDEMMPTTDYDPIQQARQYIREHLHEHLTQDRVAALVYLSRTQFIRRFREETGQTFNQFVTTCRLEQAEVLLETTDFPLTFIFGSLGYRSPTYFNTLFRKHKGMLPLEFRAHKKRPVKLGSDQ